MNVPLLDLTLQNAPLKAEMLKAIEGVIDTNRYIMGPEITGLEQEVAAYCQSPMGIGVSSGTDALLVSMMALDVKAGDEVITTPYTFFATAGCISRLGAKPVFVDVDPVTYNINPALIEAAITPRTVGIIPVHLYGQCADMDPILSLAKARGLWVLEDAAQAIGSAYKGRRAGSMGIGGCFSFFPSKNLGCLGDGGMVTANDEVFGKKVALLRTGPSRSITTPWWGGTFAWTPCRRRCCASNCATWMAGPHSGRKTPRIIWPGLPKRRFPPSCFRCPRCRQKARATATSSTSSFCRHTGATACWRT